MIINIERKWNLYYIFYAFQTNIVVFYFGKQSYIAMVSQFKSTIYSFKIGLIRTRKI